MVTSAVLIIWASLVHFTLAQTSTTVATSTASASTTTSIVQGATVPITNLLSQSSISTQFYQYWVASQINSTISSSALFTLFVPMNSAWNNLSSSDQSALSSCLSTQCSQLATVIRYHMWVGLHTSSTFQSGAASTCSSSYGLDTNTYQCLTYATQAHVAVTSVNNAWYVNGAKIVVADQQAQNFIVHFIDRWLYPVDTGTSAQAYLQTASTSASTSLVSQTCTLCSPVFSSLWSTVTSGGSALAGFYTWSQTTAGSQTGGVTMFIPYAQPLASQYSINTLASLITSMQSTSNLTALTSIAAAHVIPNRVLFLGPWIASGMPAYSCGPSNLQTLNQFVQSCDLLQFNSTTYAIEVTGNGMYTAAFIIYPNIPVENGVVHIVSNILNYEYGNLWSIVQLHPQLTRFKSYVQQDTTGAVMNYLQSTSNQYTVFVPDDASWSGMTTSITNNVTYLSTLLQLGIVQGSMTYSSLQSMLTSSITVAWSTNTGVAGNRLRFTSNLNANGVEVDGGFTSNGFLQTILSQPDLGATNGILHIVTGSAFGAPSMTIAQFLLSRPDLSTSAMYFGQMTQAWSLFSNPGNPLTVIVPTNNAWAVLSQNSQLSVIVKSGSSALLYNLLLRHYAATNTQLYGNLTTTGATTVVTTLNGQLSFSATSTSPPQYQVSYGSVTAYVNASDYNCTNGRVHIVNTVLAVTADAYNLNAGYSCQNPYTCSASAALVNGSLLLLGILLGVIGRR